MFAMLKHEGLLEVVVHILNEVVRNMVVVLRRLIMRKMLKLFF